MKVLKKENLLEADSSVAQAADDIDAEKVVKVDKEPDKQELGTI